MERMIDEEEVEVIEQVVKVSNPSDNERVDDCP